MKLLSGGICAVLLAGVFGLYWQTRQFEFISYDDNVYVAQNKMFANGTSGELLRQCFTEPVAANWHPLTMLSMTADVWLSERLGWWKASEKTLTPERQKKLVPPAAKDTGGKPKEPLSGVAEMTRGVFGEPGEVSASKEAVENAWRLDFANPASAVFHLHNLVLHALNTLLLFWFLVLIAGRNRGSAENPAWGLILAGFATAVWAWHPLRVESVAWISSRKDVLCVFWYLAGHLAYWKWLQGKAKGLLFFAGAAYILAFMAKPTAVVYPATLFLMDYCLTGAKAWKPAKMGFYALLGLITAAFCVIVLLEQQIAMNRENGAAFSVRIGNAVAAFGLYLKTFFYPAGLSFFYPYRLPVPRLQILVGGILAVLIGWLIVRPFAVRFWDDAKEFFGTGKTIEGRMDWIGFGTVWFLIALVPVIGIVQVGEASRADRYTYLSGIGISVVILQVLFWIRMNSPKWRIRLLCGLAVSVLGVLFWISHRQVGYWRSDYTLSEQAIRDNFENHVAHANLGVRLCDDGQYDLALSHLSTYGVFRRDSISMGNIRAGFSKMRLGCSVNIQPGEVLSADMEIDDSGPYAQQKHLAYAIMAGIQKCYALAEREARKATEMNPKDGYAWQVLGSVLQAQDMVKAEEALAAFEKSEALLPENSRLQPYTRKAIQKLKETER